MRKSGRTADEIRFGLTRFEVSHKKKNVLAAAIKVLQSVLDADFEKLYGKNEKEIDEVISENSVIKGLRAYKNKGICAFVAKLFGLTREDYKKLIFRILKTDPDTKIKIIKALQSHIPNFKNL